MSPLPIPGVLAYHKRKKRWLGHKRRSHGTSSFKGLAKCSRQSNSAFGVWYRARIAPDSDQGIFVDLRLYIGNYLASKWYISKQCGGTKLCVTPEANVRLCTCARTAPICWWGGEQFCSWLRNREKYMDIQMYKEGDEDPTVSCPWYTCTYPGWPDTFSDK